MTDSYKITTAIIPCENIEHMFSSSSTQSVSNSPSARAELLIDLFPDAVYCVPKSYQNQIFGKHLHKDTNSFLSVHFLQPI